MIYVTCQYILDRMEEGEGGHPKWNKTVVNKYCYTCTRQNGGEGGRHPEWNKTVFNKYCYTKSRENGGIIVM